jgi:hypothetical protein
MKSNIEFLAAISMFKRTRKNAKDAKVEMPLIMDPVNGWPTVTLANSYLLSKIK